MSIVGTRPPLISETNLYEPHHKVNNFVSYASLVAIAINSMACRYISVSYNSNRIEEAKSYFCSVFIANCFLYGIIVVLSILFIGKIELIISISPELVLQVKLTFLLSFLNMGASLIGTVYTAAAFSTNQMQYRNCIACIYEQYRIAILHYTML